MPAPTERLVARIRRDFVPGTSDDVIRRLSGLSSDAFGGQDPERVQAALVLGARGDCTRFAVGMQLLRQDWRDVLVAGGLANEDWPDRLNAELPTPSAG